MLQILLQLVLAIDVPGVERGQIGGAAKGSSRAILQVFEDVYSEALVQSLEIEAPIFARMASSLALRSNKRITYWMPTNDESRVPRSAAEKGVLLLKELLFPDRRAEEEGIVGAKYWFQMRTSTDDVSFHFDKDEGMATDQQRMRFPEYSTVSYLGDSGGPTLVFNQTVIHNGNIRVPLLPTSAWLIYPKHNKLMVNRGDLYHGSLQEMAAKPVASEREEHARLTYVVTWWKIKPLEPNCHELTDKEFPFEQLRKAGAAVINDGTENADDTALDLDAGSLSSDIHEMAPELMDLGAGGASHNERFHIRDHTSGSLRIDVAPRTAAAGRGSKEAEEGGTGVVSEGGTYELQFDGAQCAGLLQLLDLDSEKQQHLIWEGGFPVAIVFALAPQGKVQDEALHRDGSELAVALAQLKDELYAAIRRLTPGGTREKADPRMFSRRPEVFQFFLAPVAAVGSGRGGEDEGAGGVLDAMEAFGLTEADLEDAPRAVLHLTDTDTKFVMPATQPLTADALVSFWRGAAAGDVEPLASEGGDGDDEADDDEEEEGEDGGADRDEL